LELLITLYNRVTGELEIDKSGDAIEQHSKGWLTEFESYKCSWKR